MTHTPESFTNRMTVTDDDRLSEAEIAENYKAFVDGLTALTRRHGVAVQSIGGVRITTRRNGFADLVYIADLSSGDILLPDLD